MFYPLTNRLLDSISQGGNPEFLKHLKPVPLPLKTVMYEVGRVPTYAYFLTSGIASVVTVMCAGEGVEVGLIGREGVPQALHVLGPARGDTRAFMQVAGTGLRTELKRFEQEFRQNPALQSAVL